MTTENKGYSTIWHWLIIAVAIVLAYTKVFNAGFMSWDDMDYVFNIPDIHGFSIEHFKNWWTEYYIGNYQPLPIMSYALDYTLGSTEPFWWHMQSMLWHLASSIMLYAWVKRMQGNAIIALLVALLFALHPVQTESVAWVAARNKVMNAFFFFWAIYVYIGYLEDGDKRKLLWVTLLGGIAYLCKSTAIMLPFSLFAIDIWMGRKWKGHTAWLEKLPLLLLAIPIGVVTLQAQKDVDFLNLHPEYTQLHTIVFAGYAYVQYLVNLILPVKLSVLYPYPKEIGALHIIYTIIAVAIAVVGVVAYRKKKYILAGGVLFFTVNIAIVLQFVQFGEVLMADRYLYIACIGLWYPLVHWLYHLLQKQIGKAAAIGVNAAIVVVFLVVTFVRNGIWHDELSFWESVTDKFPESSIAQSSLGGIYLNKGDYAQASLYTDKALLEDRNNYKAWYNKGVIALRTNNFQDAVKALDKAISIHEYPKALFTRALIYHQSGRCNFAMPDIDKVLQKEPDNAKANFIKADCLEQEGQLKEAVYYYNKAIEHDTQEPMFYLRRGLVAARTGELNQAIKDLSLAIELKNDYAEAWYWRGIVKSQLKQMPCHDLNQARNLGFTKAEEALIELCNSY